MTEPRRKLSVPVLRVWVSNKILERNPSPAPRPENINGLQGYVSALFIVARNSFGPNALTGWPTSNVNKVWDVVESIAMEGTGDLVAAARAAHVGPFQIAQHLHSNRRGVPPLDPTEINLGDLPNSIELVGNVPERNRQPDASPMTTMAPGSIIVAIRHRVASPRIITATRPAPAPGRGTRWQVEAVDARAATETFVLDTAHEERGAVAHIGGEPDGFYAAERKLTLSKTWDSDLETLCRSIGADWAGKNVDAAVRQLPTQYGASQSGSSRPYRAAPFF